MNAELRSAIDVWLERKGNSIKRLARKAGVGYTTARRVIQGEQEPTTRTQVRLAFVVLGSEKATELFAEEFPDSQCIGAGEVLNGQEVRDALLAEARSHELIALAMRPDGTSVDEVKEVYGTTGLEVLEDLIEENILRDENGKIKADNIDLTTVPDVCNAVKLSAKQFSIKNFISGCWWSEGWSKMGIYAVGGLCREFTARLKEMRDNPEMRGEYSATVGMYYFKRGRKWL